MATQDARLSSAAHVSKAAATVEEASAINPSPANPNPIISSSMDEDDSSNDDESDTLPDGPIQGLPQLALLMARNHEFAAFSRFRDLNIKSLLYYQAELEILGKKLHAPRVPRCRAQKAFC